MGNRTVRCCISCSSGGGSFSISHTNRIRGREKIAPVVKGIQYSETPRLSITKEATLLARPEPNIKLTARAALIKSVIRRPSTKEKTTPHNMPRGNPLKKRQGQL